jgi:hypothetical protein
MHEIDLRTRDGSLRTLLAFRVHGATGKEDLDVHLVADKKLNSYRYFPT